MNELSDEDKKVWEDFTKGDSMTFGKRSITNKRLHPQGKRTIQTIDLHSMTVQRAYEFVQNAIECACLSGDKYLFVITGKSGQIRKEFESWISKFNRVSHLEQITDKDGLVGKFKLTIKPWKKMG